MRWEQIPLRVDKRYYQWLWTAYLPRTGSCVSCDFLGPTPGSLLLTCRKGLDSTVKEILAPFVEQVEMGRMIMSVYKLHQPLSSLTLPEYQKCSASYLAPSWNIGIAELRNSKVKIIFESHVLVDAYWEWRKVQGLWFCIGAGASTSPTKHLFTLE